MTENGNLYIRRGKPTSDPYVGGDIVDVYPLGSPLNLGHVQHLATPPSDGFDPHLAAHTFGPLLRDAGLREVDRLSCDEGHEQHRGTLAIAYVNTDGRVWVWVSPEHVPKEHRGRRLTGGSGWPLHNEPNGGPHIQMTSCRQCRRSWVVALTERGMTQVDVSRPLLSRCVMP